MTSPRFELARTLKRCAALANPSQVAERLGLPRSKTSRAHWVCPRHGGASLSLRCPDGALQVKCFGCDLAGDVWTLVAEVNGLDLQRDFAAVLECGAELAGDYAALDALRAPSMRADPLRGVGAAPFDVAASRGALASPEPIPPPPVVYPPCAEVEALWNAAAHPTDEPAATGYLASRGFDVAALFRRDLLRVLHASAPVFEWTRFGRRSWFEAGYTLIVPVFDHAGAMRSLRAWNPSPAEGMPKRIAPKGCSTRGLVMADFFGSAMLRGEPAPARIAIAEGEPDFLTLATIGGLLAPDRWATLGVEAGAWTEEIAARIPSGAAVAVWTHADGPGDRYAAEISQTLVTRCAVTRG